MEEAVPPQRISLARILVATDFSSASRAALLYALSIARQYQSTLYLAHIVRPDLLHRADSEAVGSAVAQAWRDGQHLTTDLLVSGQLRGINHKLLVEQGEIWESLSLLIEHHGIDMIVVGTRGRTGLAKVLLGSVAERIFRQSPCPVLTVGPRTATPDARELGLRRILYATDFTPQSLHAAAYALSLARQYQAQLMLLHVINAPPDDSTLHKGRLLEEANTRLRTLVPASSGLQLEPEFIVDFGMPGTGILDVASEKASELIVLGVTHAGEGAFASRRWTTASEVTGRALCPVLTVRDPAHK
jgi:nucleotide-binding universal stress UspA family protein